LYDEKQILSLDHCLSGGKYCTPPRYDLGISNGKLILEEDIRQKCIYLTYYKNNKEFSLESSNFYWNYMINYYDTCINVPTPRFNYQCSIDVMDKTGLNRDKVDDCIKDSFGTKLYDELMFNNQNKLLEDDYEVKKLWKIKTFPSLIVNNKTINGAWTAENVYLTICSGFIDKPNQCNQYFNPGVETSSNDFSLGSIFIIIFIVIAVNIVIIYICKKYILRRIHERVDNLDINGRINNVVSSYLALRDTK
jgi:hypothetical protein